MEHIMHWLVRITQLIGTVTLLASPLLHANAQSGSLRVAVPSPNAASLGKFGDVAVSMYTGVPDISIPLFTAKGRTLDLPIGLKYHAGGIKVEEIGSWVGIGWALEAGGSITRTVRGLVDESPAGYYNSGYRFYNPNNWPAAPDSILRDIKDGVLDGDPDQFFFSFAGVSGQFVMGPTSTSPSIRDVRTIPYRKWRIEPTISSGQIQSFVITTEDGTRYTFAAAEITTDQSTTSPFQSEAGFNRSGESYASAWHLTEVRSPSGDDVATLYYNSSYVTVHQQGRYQESFNQVTNACVPSQLSVTNQTQSNPFFLDSIKTAAHTVRFIRGNALRSDALSPTGSAQEPLLDTIKVTTPSGTVLRQWYLEHDYSTGRLTLKRLYERDRNGISLPPYRFEYSNTTLPATSAFGQDHWGYYNAAANSSLIPATTSGGIVYPGADRSPNATAMRAGSLTKITYPTGGYNEFIYEPNDYPGTTQGPNGFASVSSSGQQGPVQQSFTIGGTQTVLVTVDRSLTPSPCSESEQQCPYVAIVGQGQWQTTGISTISLAPGTYTLEASDDGYPGNSAYIQVAWPGQTIQANKAAGGLRIAEVRTADAMGTVSIRKYRYTLQSDTAKSSGVINGEPRYDYTFSEPTCSYYSRSSASKIPLGDGPVVGYTEVTVWDGTTGEFGKTRHVFRAGADGGSTGWPFFKTTSYAWERGQDIERNEYDSAGRPQRRVASSYRNRLEDAGGAEPITTRLFRGMSMYSWPGIVSYDLHFFSGEYQVISAWLYQDADTTTVYDTTGTSWFSTTKTFTYGNPNHAQLTEIGETNSDGTQRVTRMRYPADYSTGAGNAEAVALSAMQGTAHKHSPVIERWVIKRAAGIDSVVQAELKTFKAFGAAPQYLPYQRFALNSSSAVTNFVPSSVASGSLVKDSRYLIQETANAYDAQGRITQVLDARAQVTNYQYGGNPNNAFLTQVARVHDGTGTVDLITNLSYDGDGNLQSTQDEGGSFRYFTYDTFGRLRQIKNNAATVVKAFGYTYAATSPTWVFTSSSPNAVVDSTFIQQAPSVKAIVSTQYVDGLGRPIQTVVQDGTSYVITTTQYDAMGRLWRKWKPYSRTSAGYDASYAANATNFYNAYLGQSEAKPYVETQYRSEPAARISKVFPEYVGGAASLFVQHAYAVDAVAKQAITEVADELGKKRRSYGDVFGNEARVILGFGAAEATTTQLGFDVLGKRLKATDPRNLVTTYVRDTRGQLASRTTPDAGTTSIKYDRTGNLRFSQDAKQVAGGHVGFTTYDFANRPLISGDGAATFASLDPDASPSALETSGSNWYVVRYYDAKPPVAGWPWSRFSAQISPLSLVNVSGRLSAVANYSNDRWSLTLFSYDGNGRVATRYNYSQDPAGVAQPALNTTIGYVRDLRDTITQRQLTVGSNTFNQWYDYDNRGLLWKVFASTASNKPGAPDVTYTYRPSGQIQDRQFQGGPLVSLRYTIREQLERIGDPALTSYPFSARYAYNANGTVAESEFYNAGSPAVAKRYKYAYSTYDALNRLKSADFSSWNGTAWMSTLGYDLSSIGYDAAGNITSLQRYRETGSLVDNLTYTYASGTNRLSSISDAVGATTENWDVETGGFTYDANGNLSTATAAPYGITLTSYDLHNLPLVIGANGVTTNYWYDEADQRIAKRVGSGNTEHYLLDGTTILGVVTIDGAGTPVSWYFNVLAFDKPVGRQPSVGNRLYYHTDWLGSTRSVVSGATIVEAYDYDPYGVLMPGRTLGSDTKERFTGKERDPETGLDYFGARYYLSALGRWGNVDPLGDSFPSWSPYNYVLDNPMSYSDPSGRCPVPQICLALLGAGAGVVLNGVMNVAMDRPFLENWQRAAIGGAVAAATAGIVAGPEAAAAFFARTATPVIASGTGAAAGAGTLEAQQIAANPRAAATIDRLKAVYDGNVGKLDEQHLDAASRELAGEVVKWNDVAGRAYDHVTEVRNGMQGMRNVIAGVGRLLRNGMPTSEQREAAEMLRKEAVEALKRAQEAGVTRK